jgi:hypothetical protein
VEAYNLGRAVRIAFRLFGRTPIRRVVGAEEQRHGECAQKLAKPLSFVEMMVVQGKQRCVTGVSCCDELVPGRVPVTYQLSLWHVS